MRTNLFLIGLLALCTTALAEETVYLDSLDISRTTQDFGQPRAKRSINRNPIKIAGQTYATGLGTHAVSYLKLDLHGESTRFQAKVGVDDDAGNAQASVVFQIIGDGKTLFDSGVMHWKDAAKDVDVNLAGVKKLELKVDDAGDGISYDHADWADAKFTVTGSKPEPYSIPPVEPYILTPKSGPEPRLHHAKVFGVRPGHPFLFTVSATGDSQIKFSADNLPAGLALDETTGRITGVLNDRGEFSVTIHAKNDKGEDTGPLKIVVGDRIALTPPMGWNSWNCWATAVSDEKVRASADAMVSSGLINHGWTYINIDDCWEVKPGATEPELSGELRNPDGSIRTNKKFPDMKALADYVHSKGLKIGLYSSPGPTTCGGYTASYQHELDDAKQYAAWGFDYLKYDWCSYGRIAPPNPNLAEMKKPYQVMRGALDNVDRDIVYSLCQYGMGNVWEWGDQVGGNCWRTTGDITDTWRSLSSIGFSQAGHEKFAGPGHWNDPDMLIVGHVGWGANLHPTRLTPDEQYTHISLWSLLDSPLLIGCDMTQLDPFTLNLLTNDEVIAVSQDPLGHQAARIAKDGEKEIWAKDLEDGSRAVGLFNRADEPATITTTFDGSAKVRDLWRQKDLGNFDGKYEAQVPPHGVVLVKIAPVK
jgi:alpha-galactosidase